MPLNRKAIFDPIVILNLPVMKPSSVLQGQGVVVLFKDDGSVEHVCWLDLETEHFGTDIPAGWYHTIVSLQSGSVFYEVKAGPYEPAKAKEFASWAPGDNTPEAAVYLEQLKKIISEFD